MIAVAVTYSGAVAAKRYVVEADGVEAGVRAALSEFKRTYHGELITGLEAQVVALSVILNHGEEPT